MTNRRAAVGLFLIVVGIAQLVPGARTVDGLFHSWLPPAFSATAAVWLGSALWMVAMLGLMAAGFGARGVAPFASRWRGLGTSAVASSLLLVALFWTQFAQVAIVLDLAALVFIVAWGDESRATASGTPGVSSATGVAGHPAHIRRKHHSIRYVGWVAAAAIAVYLTSIVVLRHWYNNSGSSEPERRAPLAGDAITPEPAHQYTRAITVRAPASAVWPWLVQLGQDRAGVYSYDWLERAIGLDVHNVDRIVPEWQHLAVGDLVRIAPPNWLGGLFGKEVGLRVARLEPGRSLSLTSSLFNWSFVLQPLDSQTTRLIARTRVPTASGVPYYFKALTGIVGFEPTMYIMESKMLRTLKERAERTVPGPIRAGS